MTVADLYVVLRHLTWTNCNLISSNSKLNSLWVVSNNSSYHHKACCKNSPLSSLKSIKVSRKHHLFMNNNSNSSSSHNSNCAIAIQIKVEATGVLQRYAYKMEIFIWINLTINIKT